MISWWNDITFAHKEFFFLLLLIPVLIAWYIFRGNKNSPEVSLSTLSFLKNSGSKVMSGLRHSPIVFRNLGLILLIIALARPRTSSSWEDVTTEGIDITMALDISASMLARDFNPNRLEASKDVAAQFIKARSNDRIGLVVYEGESFTQCPLTSDHRVLLDLLRETRTGWIKGGTAIGMGLATSVNRLKESDAKSKVIILLTDGVNNRGSIAPKTAARIAKEFDIRIYTIGVGSRGKALSPVGKYPNGEYRYDRVKVKIDETSLKEVASMTGGKYFRATDKDKLEEIYKEIDQLERTKIQVTQHSKKTEEFASFAIAGLILLLLEFTLRNTVFKSVP